MAKKDRKQRANGSDSKKNGNAPEARENSASGRPPPTASNERQRDNLAEQEQNFDTSEYINHNREYNTNANDQNDEAGSADKHIKHEELLSAMQSLMGTLTTNTSSLNKLVHVILGGSADDFDMGEIEKLKVETDQLDERTFFSGDLPKVGQMVPKYSTASTVSPAVTDRDDEETEVGAGETNRFITPVPPAKRDVFVRMAIMKVGDVNTITMVFGCTMLIQFRWHEPELDRTSDELLESTYNSGKEWWAPDVLFDNIKGEKCTKTAAPKRYPDGKVYLVEQRKVSGDFLQVMKLRDFPMDTQLLVMMVTTEKFEEQLEFLLDLEEDSGVNTETFAKKQEWVLHKTLTHMKHDLSDAFNPDGSKHPAMSFMIRVDRKPGFFYWNIFVVMAMICGLSFALFSVPIFVATRDGVDSRLKLGYTLVLTSVTFRNTVTKNLPPLAYLTGMDKYLFVSMTFLYLMNVYHVVATFGWMLCPTFPDSNSISTMGAAENYVLIVFSAIYLLIQLVLVIWINLKLKSRKTQPIKHKKEHEEVKPDNHVKVPF